MENESQPAAPQPTVVVDKYTKQYENLMLIFGSAAVASLLFNIGPLLKLSAGIFLLAAVLSIVGSFNKSRMAGISAPAVMPASQPTQVPGQPPVVASAPKQMSTAKKIGLALLIIGAIPLLAYAAMVVIIILALMSGNARMGT